MKRSFTLIELMVVIGLVVLLSIGTIAGISSARSKKQVKATADRLRSVISDAVSSAQHPSDEDFGLQKIEVDIYPHDSQTTDSQNQVKVYNVGANRTQNQNLSFKAPKGVNLDSSQNPHDGNMTCSGSCGNINYYYFGVSASSADKPIGQLVDVDPQNNNNYPAVFLTVSDMPNQSGTENYAVKAFIQSGLVTMEKCSGACSQ